MLVSPLSGLYGIVIMLFVYLGALTVEVLVLTYGVLAVIPAGPFEIRNLALGIPLLVSGCIGLALFCGALVGALVGGILGSPLMCCTDNV
jgi:hypothetical protein